MTGALDLVEAAVRSGRPAEAATHAAALRDSAMARLSPRLHMLVLACEALTTPGDDALDLFERALSQVDPEDWVFDVARVRLFYGECLRRRRATKEARDNSSRRPRRSRGSERGPGRNAPRPNCGRAATRRRSPRSARARSRSRNWRSRPWPRPG
ncbi:hypothetical protein [Streptomyces sp. NPDC059894]|uniref:hypothetical protein n=1 Tax=unclassified Streptomyces TaxID=2593676 RepID=UPI003659FDC7